MRLLKTPSWVLVTIVLAGAAWLLAPLADGAFLTDDFHVLRFVTYGPQTGPSFDPDNSLAVFSYFGRSATESYQLYRPLVACLLRLSYDLHGLNPQPYLVENLILHLLGGLMVWLLGRRLFPQSSRLMALLAAAIFLVHPLQIQVPAWTAARSDSLAWLGGSLALYLQMGQRRRLWPALIALSLALFAKESAVAFAMAMVALELTGPGLEGRSRRQRRQRAALPFLLGLGYLGLRSFAMRGEFHYAGRSLGDLIGSAGLTNVGSSLATALGASSTLFFETGHWHDLFRLGLGLLQLSLFGLALYYSWRRAPSLALILMGLMAAPFAMATLVGPMDDNYHNTRACYISLGVLGVALAAIPRPKLAGSLALLLLIGLVPISHRVVHYYVDAAQDSAAMLTELRAGPERFAATADGDIAILNFQETNWFRGGFAFSGAVDPALTRPFCSRDWRLHKIRADRSIQGFSPQVGLDTLFARPRDRLVVVAMRPHGEAARESFELVYPPESVKGWPSAITITSPENGSSVQLDPQRPESLIPRYELSHPYGETAQYLVYLMTKNGLELRLEAQLESSDASPQGARYRIALPALPAAMATDPQVLGAAIIGIVVVAPNGDFLDASPLILVEVRGPS